MRTPRHDQAGGHEAPPVAGKGESGCRRLAGAQEAALPESSAVARDLRALDRQIRTPPPSGAERFEKRSRRQQQEMEIMKKAKLVYQMFIRSTPKKTWDAISNPKFTRQYWAGLAN